MITDPFPIQKRYKRYTKRSLAYNRAFRFFIDGAFTAPWTFLTHSTLNHTRTNQRVYLGIA